MKQINDLIVYEVPKESMEYRSFCGKIQYKDDNGDWATITNIPPGQYEIIGLYSEVVNDNNKYQEVKDAGNFDLVHIWLRHNDLLPTDTTDLLFIHKIK